MTSLRVCGARSSEAVVISASIGFLFGRPGTGLKTLTTGCTVSVPAFFFNEKPEGFFTSAHTRKAHDGASTFVPFSFCRSRCMLSLLYRKESASREGVPKGISTNRSVASV